MKCPRCYSEIPFGKTCPKCGAELHFGGNTEFLQGVNEGRIRVREIFSQTFKRHQKGDAFRSLTRHPVPAAEMLESWQRPWLYLRLFAILTAATLVLSFASSYIMPGDKSFAMIGYVIGGMVVPVSMLLFIWEMNMQGNVSIFSLTGLLLLGGQVSMVISMLFFDLWDAVAQGRELPDTIAAVAEEPGKLITCVLFILLIYRRGLNGLDGLVIGAAVAAGFGFAENTQYAFNKTGFDTILLRNLSQVFAGHILYTAPMVGALGLAANGEKLRARHFLDWRFLLTAAIGMGLHALNNSAAVLPESFTFLLVPIRVLGTKTYPLMLLIAVIAWPELLIIMRASIKQAMNAHERGRAERAARVQAAPLTLVCRAGTFAGKSIGIPFGKAIRFGRDAASCQMVLNTGSVSRLHCVVRSEGDRLLLRDLGSANGTRLNGKRIAPDQDVALAPGDVFELGTVRFEVHSGKRGMNA